METIVSKDKLFLQEKIPNKIGKPTLVLRLTQNMEDVISDFTIDEWAEDLMTKIREEEKQGVMEHVVNYTSELIFDKMRCFVKTGHLSNILVEYEGVRYDAVLGNGKTVGSFYEDHNVPVFKLIDNLWILL